MAFGDVWGISEAGGSKFSLASAGREVPDASTVLPYRKAKVRDMDVRRSGIRWHDGRENRGGVLEMQLPDWQHGSFNRLDAQTP